MLARLCGVAGDRPKGQSATDNRWVWASPHKGHRRVSEVRPASPMPFLETTSTNSSARSRRSRRNTHARLLAVAFSAIWIPSRTMPVRRLGMSR